MGNKLFTPHKAVALKQSSLKVVEGFHLCAILIAKWSLMLSPSQQGIIW